MTFKLTPLKNNEKGIVSIIVVMIIIMILTLIVLAMSRNANREQRQALDRQLSSQAFYASEAGVNDMINYIRANFSNRDRVPDQKTKCDNSEISDPSVLPSGNLSGDNLIQYSCILYDLEPPTLEFGNVSGQSTITTIQNGNSTGIKELTFSWDDDGGGNEFSGCPSIGNNVLPPVSGWTNCDAGMLRIELIDANDLSRQSIIDNNFTAFLLPNGSATIGAIALGSSKGSSQGDFVSGGCGSHTPATPRKCAVTINNIGLSGNSLLTLRMRTLYKSTSNVVISGLGQDDQPINFKNGQVMIDSTGKANDVLRRLQVRLPIRPKFDNSDFAVKTTGPLCKLLDVYPGNTGNVDTCTY